MPIEPGLTNEITHIVAESDTAAVYGSGLAPVLSTPHLVALMENAARTALTPYLESGQSTVGTGIDIRHLAATPVGIAVRIRAEVTEVALPRVCFRVEAWDAVEKIGEGHHERFIVDTARFMARVTRKQGA
ncbi:MAG TPA: thioesterase family protein [Anaerolineae bacterium]|nr:thioesterase family protein [Anaerolineae bacterium]HQI87514.1 thioesterase family protein [Anaerolineae bacterium]